MCHTYLENYKDKKTENKNSLASSCWFSSWIDNAAVQTLEEEMGLSLATTSKAWKQNTHDGVKIYFFWEAGLMAAQKGWTSAVLCADHCLCT